MLVSTTGTTRANQRLRMELLLGHVLLRQWLDLWVERKQALVEALCGRLGQRLEGGPGRLNQGVDCGVIRRVPGRSCARRHQAKIGAVGERYRPTPSGGK
ncbi:hypothetical protein G3480_21900 [Thiorhodococcus mannitoliphagus]|uniref:Uncharacterized protein n=1 Tax=Thiorhodococcus mannitoliphagus TaxID=329406 RepID=A0A6P1E356_9GAMM|nr:hypothetical protein [Thiorhodococcus mannitoliphagus]NEX22922.1 hypothetical protein [Thiorhodococcus mannitoliphagus]